MGRADAGYAMAREGILMDGTVHWDVESEPQALDGVRKWSGREAAGACCGGVMAPHGGEYLPPVRGADLATFSSADTHRVISTFCLSAVGIRGGRSSRPSAPPKRCTSSVWPWRLPAVRRAAPGRRGDARPAGARHAARSGFSGDVRFSVLCDCG